jgi:hypothetical protein
MSEDTPMSSDCGYGVSGSGHMTICTPAAYVLWHYGELGWYPVFGGA